jgi:ribosomal protein S27AE
VGPTLYRSGVFGGVVKPEPCPRCGGVMGDGDRVSHGICGRCLIVRRVGLQVSHETARDAVWLPTYSTEAATLAGATASPQVLDEGCNSTAGAVVSMPHSPGHANRSAHDTLREWPITAPGRITTCCEACATP